MCPLVWGDLLAGLHWLAAEHPHVKLEWYGDIVRRDQWQWLLK